MTRPRCRGYSLIELLVVLSIVGILAMVGVTRLGNRSSQAVKGGMDELEATLVGAQRATLTTQGDIILAASGNWNDGSMRLDGRRMILGALDPFDLTKRIGAEGEVFRPNRDGARNAGVATAADWYTTALGTGNNLAASPMFQAEPFKSALATPLFTGAQNRAVVNGLSKRFETGFSIVVVSLSAGNPVPDGSMGVLVVPAGGAGIYRFYRPAGEKDWVRQ